MVSRSGRTTAVQFRVPNAAYDLLAAQASRAGKRPQDLARELILDAVRYEPPLEPEKPE